MADDSAEIVRRAFLAFLEEDLDALRLLVAPDLEWTYLDPSSPDPTPATCSGRGELERAAANWSRMALSTEIEELEARGDKVVVILHTPGLDGFRARRADDRNFHVVTVKEGAVSTIRACRDRLEARAHAGLADASPGVSHPGGAAGVEARPSVER